MSEGPAKGDPEIQFPEESSDEDAAFAMVREVVAELNEKNGPVVMSGLKNQIRKRDPHFSEKQFGYSSFLQFIKAAQTRGVVTIDFDDQTGDYVLGVS